MLKIGLVGVGYLGSRHLKHLCDIPDIDVSGVWDNNPATLQKTVDEFGVKAASSLDDLINHSDAVDVVTPTITHCEVGLKVIKAGLPLFIEKPICATVAEAEELIARAEAENVIIQVGHIERFNRAFRALHGLDIKPRFLEVHRLSPWNPRGHDVAVVHDLMIHDLDLVLTLAAGDPVSVHANGVGVITDSIDIATARIDFSCGMVANITASRISLKRMRKLRMFGSNAYISLDLGEGKCEYIGVSNDKNSLGDLGNDALELELGDKVKYLFQKPVDAEPADALRLQLESFYSAVINKTQPPVTGRDGLRALELAERIVNQINERNRNG